MILYNSTFIVEEKIHDDWFDWLKNDHINDYLKSSCFLGARLGKLTSYVESGAVSYSLQLYFISLLLSLKDNLIIKKKFNLS